MRFRFRPFTAFVSLFTMLSAAALTLPQAGARPVGEVDVDWLGNDVIVEAVADPKVSGVTCHVAYFERGLIDRLQKGDWFQDPSNSSLSCRQTGPIVIGDIDLDEGGEKVFSQRQSLIWKSVRVTRVYDASTDTLVYLAHATQVQDGSAKMSLSTVPLFGQDVTWTNGKPAN